MKSRAMLIACMGMAGANALWAGNLVSGQLLAADMSPLWSSFFRWLLAAVVLTVIWWRAKQRPKFRLAHVVLGISGMVLFNWFLFGSLALTSASEGSLIFASNPALIGLFALILTADRPTGLQWLGLMLAIVGAAYLSIQSDGSHFVLGAGALLMFGASLCWAFYTAYGRRVLKDDTDVLSCTTYATWASLPLLLMAAGLFGGRLGPAAFSKASVSLLLYSGIFSASVAFIWWNKGVAVAGLAIAGPFSNLLAVFTPILAFALLGEAVTPHLLVGGGIVLLGALMSSLPQKSSRFDQKPMQRVTTTP